MTHDPREALEPFARIPLSHTDDIDDSATVFKYEGGAITLGDLRRVHAALTASPGEQEPVAHRIRVVDGSYCKVIPDGELEIWKQNWSTHLKSGHALLEPLYLSTPPAAGWNEAQIPELVEIAWNAIVGSDIGPKCHNASVVRGDIETALRATLKALRREAPAPEGVASIVTCCVTGAIPGDGGACGDCDPCIMGEASVPEAVKRLIAEKNSLIQRIGELEDASGPDAGGGVREAFVSVLASLAAAISTLERMPKAKKAAPSDTMFAIMLDDYRKALETGRAALSTPPAAAEKEADDWRDDPSADERWNAGLDFAMVQFCAALGVDPKSVRWDAATETLDGDVNAVIWNILRARFGEDWDPATADSNASVEARLREAVLVSIDMIENCAGAPTNPDSLPQMVKVYLQQTISAVGDEAKKSDGAIYAEVSKRETPPEERAEIERVIDKALQDQAVCEALERRPSDPNAERREIVARFKSVVQIMRSANKQGRLMCIWNSDIETMDAILAALDGGRP